MTTLPLNLLAIMIAAFILIVLLSKFKIRRRMIAWTETRQAFYGLLSQVNNSSTRTELAKSLDDIEDFYQEYCRDSIYALKCYDELKLAYYRRRRAFLPRAALNAIIIAFAISLITSCVAGHAYVGGPCNANKNMVGYNRH